MGELTVDQRYYFEVAGDGRLLGRFDAALPEVIPESAVPVTRKAFDESLVTQRGMVCFFRGGKVEYRPIPGALEVAERAWRNTELERVKWLRERHRDQQEIDAPPVLSGEQFAELLTYMQALRDWPQSELFPDIEQRPPAPAWIAEQIQ